MPFPVPSLGLCSGAKASVSFLACSSSFCPQRESLATSSAAVQLPRFGIYFILSLVNSLRPASRLPEGPRRAPLTFPPLWSVPHCGRSPSHWTVSPHSNPSQPPAWSHSPAPPCPVLCQAGRHQARLLLPSLYFWLLFPSLPSLFFL